MLTSWCEFVRWRSRLGSGRGCCCSHKWINKWHGPFIGVDFTYRPCGECWSLFAELEYHWANFNGKRRANQDFDYFGLDHHKFRARNADSWSFAAGVDYDLCNGWTVGLAVKFQDWKARRHRRGTNRLNESYDENLCCDGDRERHNFKWRSSEVKLAFGRGF